MMKTNHPMKSDILVFLDFDGVLHPKVDRSPKQQCLNALEQVFTECSRLKIIICSTWREAYSLKELVTFLGPVMGLRVIGVTPVLNDLFLTHERYHEVMKYLKTNGLEVHPWKAIDDAPELYPSDAPLLQIDPLEGFTLQNGDLLQVMIQSLGQTSSVR
jgi:hypothetical protein